MAELAHFKNFAKLKDTSIEFNDITVLAGKPGTGKSYVMKFMYAVDEMYYQMQKNMLVDYTRNILSVHDNLPHDILLNRINKTQVDKKNKPLFYMNNLIKSIFGHHGQISSNYIVRLNEREFSYQNSTFNVQGVALINNGIIKFYSQSIFVETPLILELYKFMDKRAGKTPYHIESLLNILDTDYSFTDEEQDEFIKEFTKKSKEVINGKIESSGDSFIFNQEGGKNYDILNASSGTKSIGLLQYLVTNKALKKGSVLFWEEPEVHLHPEWQLKMVELFIELMNAGVKIVFSTHSPYMADYLNAISKKENYRDRISFNVLNEKDGVVTNHILDDDNWNILQSELMDTFEDILWQYL